MAFFFHSTLRRTALSVILATSFAASGCGGEGGEEPVPDPCEGVDCSGRGTCVVEGGDASCRCESGYHAEGLECVENDPDPCEEVSCGEHGTCVAEGEEPACQCDPGFHAEGLECVRDVMDPCEGVDCSGHGTCFVAGSEVSCVCDFTWHADGLTCVRDDLPSLECSGGWITHDLAAPLVRHSIEVRSQGPDELTLRTGMISSLSAGLCDNPPGHSGFMQGGIRIMHFSSSFPRHPEAMLVNSGLEHIQVMGRGFHLVWIPPQGARPADICALPGLDACHDLPAGDRIGSRLERRAGGELIEAAVYRYAPFAAQEESVSIEERLMTAADARKLAWEPDVLFVDEAGPGPVPLTHVARAAVHSEEVQDIDLELDPPVYNGLTGRGIVVAVVDTGVDSAHPDLHAFGPDGEDLGTRVVGDEPFDDSGHGTNVAGVIAGNGIGSEGVDIRDETGTPYLWRGHAPGVARIVSLLSGVSHRPWVGAFIENNAYISNHSYVHSAGNYDYLVAEFDKVIREGASWGGVHRPPRVSIFAAANNGLYPNHDLDLYGYYSILSPGKNTLCVGGTNANDDTYASGASAGPTLDGRIKPDVVAPGFKKYMPPEGVALEIDEIRLVAAEGSEAEDVVWSFENDGETDGWVIGDGLEDAVVNGGKLSATTVGLWGGDSEALVYDIVENHGEGYAADDYDRLEVRLRLEVGGVEGQHQWPWFWVFSWDNEGEAGFDGNRYPRYARENRDDAWHTHSVNVADARRWTGTIRRIRVWPSPYDDRVVILRPGGGYAGSSGTSLAAPVAAGVVALLMEKLETGFGLNMETFPPHPSTFKALLIHTARDLVRDEPWPRDPPNPDTEAAVFYHEGPDFATGFGLIDASTAVSLVEAHSPSATKMIEDRIEAGEVHLYAIPVVSAAGSGALKITLAWDDAEGSIHLAETEPVLVNDLDMVLLDPDTMARSPWILDPLPMDEEIWDGIEPIEPGDVVGARQCVSEEYWKGEETASCEDHRNNVEQIVVNDPPEGWYILQLRGREVPAGPQRYSLVVSQACE